MKLIKWAAAAAGVALVVGGCGTTSEEAAQDTTADNAAVCQSLDSLSATFDQVGAGAASAATSSETVTVDDASAALDTIQKGWSEVKSSAADLSESVQTQMDMALSDYSAALKQIDGGDSLAAASAEVATAQSNLQKSYSDIKSELGC